MDIYERIKLKRKQSGLSQEELADRVGVSRQAVSKWESGLNVPETDKIILLSSALGVSADYLLLGKEDTNDNQNNDAESADDGAGASIRKKLSKKAKIAIISAAAVVLAIVIAVTVIVCTSGAMDIMAIVRSPDGTSATVIYRDTVETDDGTETGAFTMVDYEGLHGGKFEEFRLKYFPHYNYRHTVGGEPESFTYLPDNTGYVIEYYNESDHENRQIWFVSLTDGITTNIGSGSLQDRLYEKLGMTYPDDGSFYYYSVDFLMFHNREAIFYYDLNDGKGNSSNGWFFADIDELRSLIPNIDAVVQND